MTKKITSINQNNDGDANPKTGLFDERKTTLVEFNRIKGSSNATSCAFNAISVVISPSGTKSLITMSSPSALVH